jgi:hypothetical protein
MKINAVDLFCGVGGFNYSVATSDSAIARAFYACSKRFCGVVFTTFGAKYLDELLECDCCGSDFELAKLYDYQFG